MNPTAKRLIDANELRSKACSAMLEIANTPLPNEYSSKLALKMGEMFQKLIDEEPTIDAEPVRHGKNVTATHPSDMFVCSECGFSCEITEIRYEDGMGEPDSYEYDCKHCPDCGAKMRGDEDATD